MTCRTLARNALPTLLLVALWITPALGQTLAVPIRWCVVGEDLNGNGVADPGERGAPVFTDPGNVGEPDTDNALWRRHERASERTLIPFANVTLRSGLRNIVDAEDLHFPIIADPIEDVSTLPEEEYGDIFPDWEGVDVINACAAAWGELGVGDDGVMVINVNRLLTTDFVNGTDNDPFRQVAEAYLGSSVILIRDNAYVLPGSALIPAKFDVLDDADKHLAHEVGHALDIDGFPGVSADGLTHTCVDTNFMRTRRRDLDEDGLVDNIRMSSSIDQIRFAGDSGECTAGEIYDEDVDQIAAVRFGAENTAGCKIAGTNTDCTDIADLLTDRLGDAAADYLDLNLVRARLTHDGFTEFRHAALEIPSRPEPFDTYGHLEFWIIADVDASAGTGGGQAALEAIGAEPLLDGIELVTRVRVDSAGPIGGTAFEPPVTGTAWTWSDSLAAFEPVSGRVEASFVPHARIIEVDDGPDIERPPFAYSVVVRLSTADHVAFGSTSRLQAVTVGVPLDANAAPDVDFLDGEGDLTVAMVPPTFPTCAVSGPTAPGQSFTVSAQGLVPSLPAHAAVGHVMMPDEEPADAAGAVTLTLSVPSDFAPGAHLVTVGTVNTALTADCMLQVTRRARFPLPAILGIVVVLLLVVWIVVRGRGGSNGGEDGDVVEPGPVPGGPTTGSGGVVSPQ